MSVILGVHLPKRLYLVSDTRLTKQDGSVEDDFIKCFFLNTSMSVVAAGSAPFASHVLNRLRNLITDESRTPELKHLIDTRLQTIVREYVNSTGRVNQPAAFVFAGFNGRKRKRINSTRLGDLLYRAGRSGELATDADLMRGLERAMQQTNGRLLRDQYIKVDIPGSEMFTLQVEARQDNIYADGPHQVGCFDYAVFHPRGRFVTVGLPESLLWELEFRPNLRGNFEEMLRTDTLMLTQFVWQTIQQYDFAATVGGHIFVILQTQGGWVYSAGELGEVTPGGIVSRGGLVHRNHEWLYLRPDGTQIPYRFLKDYAQPGSSLDLI
jgi:hypothetical protein